MGRSRWTISSVETVDLRTISNKRNMYNHQIEVGEHNNV